MRQTDDNFSRVKCVLYRVFKEFPSVRKYLEIYRRQFVGDIIYNNKMIKERKPFDEKRRITHL